MDAMQVEMDDTMFEILKHPFYLEILDSLVGKSGTGDLHLLSTKAQFIKFHYKKIVCGDPAPTGLDRDKEKLLSHLADKMMQSKRLKLHYMHTASPEFKSLRSDGIILDDSTFVQFFHQLYFDFIMSMKILDSESVADYLKNIGEEPFLRSTALFLLSYLHSEDFDLYKTSIKDLILDVGVEDYWKRLAVAFIGQLKDLDAAEEKFVADLLGADQSFRQYFLESAIENKNGDWLRKWGDSVFVDWSKDRDFRHGDLLTTYLSMAHGWLYE